MMKTKFSKHEKVAGLFTLLALGLSLFTFLGIAVKKGWFSPKESFYTYLPTAEGVNYGTGVQMSGLKIGSVKEVNLISQDRVKVTFEVFSDYASQIGEKSQVMVFRPFIVGDKVLDVQMAESDGDILKPGSEIPFVPTSDIMDILSGKKMGEAMASLEHLAKSLKIFSDAFADGERAKDLVKILDQMRPLVKNLNTMSLEVSKLSHVALREQRLETLLENVNELTEEFKKVTPAIEAIAPDLPQTSLRAVEALNEAVVLLKAMQKSFFIRGHVQTVKEEESERRPTSKDK